MRKNKLTIKNISEKIGCSHVVIIRIRKNLPIINRIALKIQELTNGEVTPKVAERGRKKGSKVKNPITKHNMCKRKEYHIWCRIRRCCYHQRFCQYKSYGALGITICPEWNDFKVFIKEMGSLPNGYKSIFLNVGLKEFNKKNCYWVKDARGIKRNELKTGLFKKKAQSDSGPLGRDGRPLQMSFDENMVIT